MIRICAAGMAESFGVATSDCANADIGSAINILLMPELSLRRFLPAACW